MSRQKDPRRRKTWCFRPLLEELEGRLTPSSVAHVSFQVQPDFGGSSPTGFTPLQILEAYGFYNTSSVNNISFNGTPADGRLQTIAIVDAYHDPNIGGDLAAFDAQYGLPAPASFQVLNQNGVAGSYPQTDSSGGWEMEEALDVEWAHVIAPAASIVLVEANSPTDADLDTAVVTAAGLPGVSVVSMSWSGGEFDGEQSEDSVFATPNGHQGVTFLAATGDTGSPAGYPAYSPNVVAVGGTSLFLNSNNSYKSETAWSDGGGGPSTVEAEPTYQLSVQSTGVRTVPDVSFVADPDTGVPIYDSFDNPSGPWTQIGGTSLSTPSWAGVIALINQGRVAQGGTTLDGPSQTLPGLYAIPGTDFHDITTGGNGTYNAGPGYDEVTGRGTPIANLLIPDMVGYDNVNQPSLTIATPPPSSVASGAPFEFTANVMMDGQVDAGFNGDVTVALANNPDGSTLSSTTSFTAAASDGVVTFSGLSLNMAGTGYTLGLSATGVNSTATTGFSVTAGQASQVVVKSQPPVGVVQNTAFSASFAIEDASGNVLTADNTDTVTVSLASGSGTLAGTLTVTVKSGIATFSTLTIAQGGSGYSLEATTDATIGSLTSAPTNTFAITTKPTHLQVIAQPSTSVSTGTPFSVTVAAEDGSGNIVSSFAGTVTVSLSADPTGSALSGTLTATASGGQVTFSNLIVNKPGTTYVLQFATSGLTAGKTNAITAVVGASRLVVTAQPAASVGSMASIGFTVAVEDSFGNIATGYVGSVTVGIGTNPGGGTLNGNTTVSVSSGSAQFSGLSINKSGTGYTLTVTGISLTSATTSKFNVTAGTATQLVVKTAPPSSVAASSAFTVVIAAEDAQGNVATSYSGKVTIALAANPGSATLGGTLTVSVVNGLATFSTLTLSKAGTGYSLKASSSPALTTVTTGLFNATAPATKLVVTSEPPSSVAINAPFSMTVSIENASGGVVTSYNGLVTVSIVGDPFGGTVTVQAVNGVATFSLDLSRTGSNTLQATASGLTSAKTTPITVTGSSPFAKFVL